MRRPLQNLDGRRFEVAVIGAGDAAQHLAAAGYEVLLVDKSDYGSGSSSRSSRLLHCGLRYFAPGSTIWEFARHPSWFKTSVRMAHLAMQARRQIVMTAPERTCPLNFHFPIWATSIYRRWQVKFALRVLQHMAPGDVPLERRLLTPAAASRIPLVNRLRDWHKLEGIGAFREYQFEWPERLCLDAVMDAARLGAVVRNYTIATKLTRAGDLWEIELVDRIETGQTACVRSTIVLNMAGIWIDKVNASSGTPRPRKILPTKGIHIMVQLPDEGADNGIVTFNRRNQPLYCIPWRGMHYFGPTETVYDGDLDDVRPTEMEIECLLAECNYLLPSLRLTRKDVLFSWAGVRPLSYDPAIPNGKRSREVHDLASVGMSGVFAMSAGPIMTHRSAGTEMVDVVARHLKASHSARSVDYSARLFPDNQNSPPLLADWSHVKISDLRYAAEHEQVTNLIDLLFRRVGVGWTRSMGCDVAKRAAEAVADVLGWDKARVEAEVQAYHLYLQHFHLHERLADRSSSPPR
jgi:glycerol-3-phosphate dehydrogenase